MIEVAVHSILTTHHEIAVVIVHTAISFLVLFFLKKTLQCFLHQTYLYIYIYLAICLFVCLNSSIE